MDFSNVQAQLAIKCEGIREVKGSLSEADIKSIKNDGLKEVFFEADHKKYVAFGKDMDVSQMKNTLSGSFKGAEITINFTDDEANTAWEGAKSSITSTGGKWIEGSAVVLGTGMGLLSSFGNTLSGSATKSPGALRTAVVFGVITAGIVGTVGAFKGGLKEANYEALKSISNTIK